MFLAWAEGQGVELAAITPGVVGQYLVVLGGLTPILESGLFWKRKQEDE